MIIFQLYRFWNTKVAACFDEMQRSHQADLVANRYDDGISYVFFTLEGLVVWRVIIKIN